MSEPGLDTPRPDTGRPPPDNAPETLSQRRLLYWSVRRELWEHRALYVAPVVIAVVALFGSAMSTFWLPRVLRSIADGSRKAGHDLMGPYSFIALTVMITGLIVTLVYASTALHGERKDRSLLFWKSLPVSDLTTVMSKMAVPMVVTPVVIFTIVFAAQLALLVWSNLIVLMNGLPPSLLWQHVNPTTLWVVLAYGLIVNALWQAPLYAWLLLVSGWARRVPFLWAVGPFVGLLMLETIFRLMARAAGGGERTAPIGDFIGNRVLGGFAEAFSVDGKATAPIDGIGQLDPVRTFSQPDLWLGLFAAAALLAAAVWLRRRREPL